MGKGSLTFLCALLSRDISRFNHRDLPNPVDEDSQMLIRENKLRSADSVEKFVYDWVIDNEGHIGGVAMWGEDLTEEISHRIPVSTLKEEYHSFCRENGGLYRESPTRLNSVLEKYCLGNNVGQCTNAMGVRSRGWQFKSDFESVKRNVENFLFSENKS